MTSDLSQIDRQRAHQRRNRLARLIACSGVMGFVQWCVVVLAVAFFGVMMVRSGEWLQAAAAVGVPALLVYAVRAKLVDLWPATRHALNALGLAIIVSVILRRSVPILSTPEVDLIRLGACALHASTYFWVLSDRGLVPSK